MPGMFSGKDTEHTEYVFKMEVDPGGKGGEILRAAATEAKDMDDDEVTKFAAIYWNVPALNSALASCFTQRVRPRFRQGRSTEEDDDSRDGRTLHQRPKHVP